MPTISKWATPPAGLSRPIAALVALAGLAVVGILVAFGPMLVVATGLTGGMHGAAYDESVFTVAIFGPILLAGAAGGAAVKVASFALGTRPWAMLASGLALGLSGILAATAFAWIANCLVATGVEPVAGLLLLGLATVALQVVAEEVYFRGWLQPPLARAFGLRVAVPVVAVGFAALHVLGGARDLVAPINLLLGGLAFGLLAARAGGIGPAIGMHLGWNGVEQLVLGMDPNPGLGSFGAVFDLDMVGSSWWGGSTEGMNASTGMTIALLAILVPLLFYAPRGTTSKA